MTRNSWRRLLAQFLLGGIVFVALAYLVLWASGRFLSIHKQGGDQSQSGPLDASPALAAPPLPALAWDEVRNVVLVLGDGMGFSQVMAARSELRRLNEKLFFERFPVTGWHTTHSVDAIYTDSASSASSLATGRKVPYLAVSTDASGRPHRTVFEAARDRGLAVGAVTDSYLWDATIAAFMTHVPSRRDLYGIASQMAASGVHLLIGGAEDSVDLDAPPDADSRDDSAAAGSLRERFQAAGFRIVHDADALAALDPASDEPVLGLFPTGQIADPETAPRLPELASFAIAKLSRDPDGFFLVVESEEPDTGSHKKDLGRLVRGVQAIEQIAASAAEVALADLSTLVLVTGDHETGGLSILHGDADHRMGVRWATSSHSAEPVPIYAFGAGAERFAGVKDNTDIARILSDLLGLAMFD